MSYQIKNIRKRVPFTTGNGKNFNMDEIIGGEKGDKVVATYEAKCEVELESKVHTPLHEIVRYRLVKFFPSGKWCMAESGRPITHPR